MIHWGYCTKLKGSCPEGVNAIPHEIIPLPNLAEALIVYREWTQIVSDVLCTFLLSESSFNPVLLVGKVKTDLMA